MLHPDAYARRKSNKSAMCRQLLVMLVMPVLLEGGAAAALDRRGTGSSRFVWADSYGSHMVLQQLPAPTVLWGFAAPGTQVSVRRLPGSRGTGAANATNVTGPDGVWWVQMEGRPAGNETFTFKARRSKGRSNASVAAAQEHVQVTQLADASIQMDDVVYGDVWVCSGQSNMAVVVAQVFNATDVLREATAYSSLPTNPLRLFAANMSCAHGKVCHFQNDSAHLSACTRPPCFTTGPNAGWTPATAQALSSDGKGNVQPVWTGSFSAVCYLFGRKIQAARKYPVGLVSSFIGGTPDECWSSTEALAKCPPTPHSKAHMDWGDCWYSMITPLLRTPIFGAIWYQGETDTDVGGAAKDDAARAVGYACTFRAMLEDWRAKFHAASFGITSPTFPFGIVQLAPWSAAGKDGNNDCGQSNDCEVAQVRWGQTANVGNVLNNTLLPNTFMAVTTDLADFDSPYGSIHPRHKIPVGDRLALGARSVAYKESGVYWAGPVSPTARLDPSGVVRVQFQACAAGGIQLHDTAGFEVRSNGTWQPAAIVPNATTQAHCAVDLEPPAFQTAQSVRYNWYRSTCWANETKKDICGIEGCGAGRCAVYSGGTATVAEDTSGAVDVRSYSRMAASGPPPGVPMVHSGLPAGPFVATIGK